MTLKIVKIRRKDNAEIFNLMAELPEWFNADALKNIRIDLKYQKGFLAKNDNNEIVAFLMFFVYEGVGHIAWMGVKKEYQGRGAGSTLLAGFEKEMLRSGVKKLQVYTLGESVEYKPYESTRNFYYKNGFKEYRRIFTDNAGCPEELHLRKDIGA